MLVLHNNTVYSKLNSHSLNYTPYSRRWGRTSIPSDPTWLNKITTLLRFFIFCGGPLGLTHIQYTIINIITICAPLLFRPIITCNDFRLLIIIIIDWCGGYTVTLDGQAISDSHWILSICARFELNEIDPTNVFSRIVVVGKRKESKRSIDRSFDRPW